LCPKADSCTAANFAISLIFVDLPRQEWRAPNPKMKLPASFFFGAWNKLAFFCFCEKMYWGWGCLPAKISNRAGEKWPVVGLIGPE
jgi:hypothetical protein